LDSSRRSFLWSGVKGAVTLAAAPFVHRDSVVVGAGRLRYSRRTVNLIEESLVIDMLGLLTLDWAKQKQWFEDPSTLEADSLERIRQSRIRVFHPAIEYATKDRRAFVSRLMAEWQGFVSHQPNVFRTINSGQDFKEAFARRQVGILLGMQNSSHFSSVADVEHFHRLGQRVSQLTYNTQNLLGAGCTERRDDGLTAFGAAVVAEMNRVGMAIDVSHSGDRTTLDTIRLSRQPVLITHSNCRALVPAHPRCKPDLLIRECAARGGVMGITGIRAFVRPSGSATVENALDHFDHVARLVGVEHIGIGSDTDLGGRDGSRFYIEGLNHSFRVYDLTEGLVRRRYSDRAIQGILGENFRRVLTEIWSPGIETTKLPIPSLLPNAVANPS
jgi:membrane dipeptidase